MNMAEPATSTAPRPKLLIVDDDHELCSMLAEYLGPEGFLTEAVGSGPAALERLGREAVDLVVLDVMLPELSGFEVLRRIRALNRVPVIMLTARGEEGDRVRGLNSGADDYVVKPFSLSELVARLRAVIRRAQPNADEQILHYADVTMDLVAHRVSRAGKPVHLGPTEFRLLRHFLQSPQRVFSREQLLDQVWSQDAEIELRTVDVHIRRLRKALNQVGTGDLLRTVRSVGYALDRVR
jgi:two-component system, OmpR family, phosphate regulon response regulator PhoB